MNRKITKWDRMFGFGVISSAKRMDRVKKSKWGERTVPIRKL